MSLLLEGKVSDLLSADLYMQIYVEQKIEMK